jgi:2-polyprenyl-6-methoxyphenol hydroxylase-like FAD-dependent oxidoreductase
MRHTDVAIVGGGLAGSITAAMLGRAGIDTVLIDPHRVYPPDFRCEKLDRTQVGVLQKTGLGDAVRAASTESQSIWIVRNGGASIARRPSGQYHFLYDTLVNAVRGAIPESTGFIEAKATALSTSGDRQHVTLSNGEEISARLIVMAIGLNIGLRHTLGMTREVVSPEHSITIGFNMKPIGRDRFDFPAMTFFPETLQQRVSYLSLFPIGDTMRANFFVYRDMRDPWLRAMRKAPVETLCAALPGLDKVTGAFEVAGDVRIRPVDLYVTGGHRQAGIVLLGDAFATSCPAAGTGSGKAMTDAWRLAEHIPAWLATEGMGADKIAAFYDDPIKVESDMASAARAQYVRAIATDTSLAWTVRRWRNTAARTLGLGALRDFRERMALGARTPAST